MRKLSLFLGVILICAWLLTTNSGLNATLRLVEPFLPVKMQFAKAEGQIIGAPIRFKDLKVEKDENILAIEYLEIDWQFGGFQARNIQGLDKLIPANQFLQTAKPSVIRNLYGRVEYKKGAWFYRLNAQGKWLGQDLKTTIYAVQDNGIWLIQSGFLQVADNIAMAHSIANHSYEWLIDFKYPEKIFKDIKNKILAKGNISDLNTKLPKISAKVITDNIQININGSLKQHYITSLIKFDSYQINVKASGTLQRNVWQTSDLVVNSEGQNLIGGAIYDFNKNIAKLKLNGQLFAINTAANLSLYKNKLDGAIDLATGDISPAMKLIPEMTRLKGNLKANIKIGGTTDDPIVKAQAQVTEITATFPGLGIKIKPMDLYVKTDNSGKFIIDGYGKMRRGSGDFTIKGFVEPFKENMPNTIKVVGKNIEFINNQFAHLTASNELDFHYEKDAHRLDIDGYIEIEQGDIYFDTKINTTVKSNDVIFVGDERLQKELNINPSINLRILEATHFNGFNLDATISGKLEIAQRNSALYALGRVTIKEGTYKLPGQKLGIHKGRLLFPPGTLLSNPSLDIKMAGSKKEDLDLVVQGTAQKPIIRESSIAENKDKALSQIVTASGGMITESMDKQGRFRMPEIGIASREEYNNSFFDDPSKHKSNLRNKDLVVGMPLGKRLHLQYLQGLSDLNMNDSTQAPSKRLRLKYNLHKNWNLGLETGDQGQGIDLGFSFER